MCCTLINKPSAEVCDACLTSRPEGIERLSGPCTGERGEGRVVGLVQILELQNCRSALMGIVFM